MVLNIKQNQKIQTAGLVSSHRVRTLNAPPGLAERKSAASEGDSSGPRSQRLDFSPAEPWRRHEGVTNLVYTPATLKKSPYKKF